jgi:hypothetical protein
MILLTIRTLSRQAELLYFEVPATSVSAPLLVSYVLPTNVNTLTLMGTRRPPIL